MILIGFAFILVAAVLGIVQIVFAVRKKPVRLLSLISIGAFFIGAILTAANSGKIMVGFSLSGLLVLILAVVSLMQAMICRIRKHPAARHAWRGLLLLICAVGLVFFGLLEICDFTQLFGIFLLLFGAPMLIVWIVRLIKKKHSPVLKWAAPGIVAAAVVLLAVTPSLVDMHYSEMENNHEQAEIEIRTDYDFVVEDGAEPIEVIEATLPNTYSNRTYIYGSDELYRLFGDEEGTAEGCISVLRANPDIPDRFKDYFEDFINSIAEKYPDATLTILQYNLQTLHVEELSRMDYIMKSLSNDSYGVYVNNENAIYIPEGTEYTEGTWGYQVLLHEFCHAARDCWLDGDNTNMAYFSALPESTLLLESMNSAFSCSLLDYYEWDIAYQVPSNYLRIMLECMDNYNLADYMNHGDTYFYRKLDEAAGYTNYAMVLWQLITLQRSDWSNDRIDIDETEYYPIYDFLCELYYNKYLQPDMSPEEARKVADDLVYKAFYDAPEGYKICEQRFYDNLEARLSLS